MHSGLTSSSPGFIVVSNRGPIEHHLGPGKQIEVKRSGGGVVTALSAVREHQDFAWIASAITPGDRLAARTVNRPDSRALFERGDRIASGPLTNDDGRASPDGVEFVVVPKHVFHNHYEVFSNRILWFLQHSMWDTLQAPKDKKTIGEAWWNGYVPANVAFAQAVRKKAKHKEKTVVMLHDYHLYLAPGFVRQQSPDALLQQFIHIPWPEPETWEPIPAFLRREICRSLLANDIVGFQTAASVRSFLRCCDEFVEAAEIDYGDHTVRVDKRYVRIRSYPISVDTAALGRKMNSPTGLRHIERLRPLCGDQTIVRVDRLEPTKNIAAGFRAFECLLDNNPDLVGKVRFLAFLVPSRTGVPEYQQCHKEVIDIVRVVNSRFGRDGFLPIEIIYENNYEQALAGMSLGDVTLVNPLADGMNLVAKESPIVSAKDSVLVLSRSAGAFEQLGAGAIGVDPTDIAATALALEQALHMPETEKRRRIAWLRTRIQKEDVAWWIKSQLKDIREALIEQMDRGERRRALLGSAEIPTNEPRAMANRRVPGRK